MALFIPSRREFNFFYSNVSATALAQGWGFSHTSGTTPTFSTYATLVAAANITTDIFGIELLFTNAFNANSTRNVLVNIGIDTAGGTSFTTRIPQLIIGHCGSGILHGGIHYVFPLYIPRGSSIGIQAAGSAAIPFNTAIKLYGKPRNPDGITAGSYVVNYGTTLGTGATGATGTVLGNGTGLGQGGAEGTYVLIGTTTRDHWWWQMGYTYIDTNVAAQAIAFDMAIGSSTTLNKLVFENMLFFADGTERIWNEPTPYFGQMTESVAGDNVYIRGSTNVATAEVSSAVAAYGLGG